MREHMLLHDAFPLLLRALHKLRFHILPERHPSIAERRTAGATVRHFYNERHAGRGNLWTWALAAFCMIGIRR
jgi:hypothetical protein